MAIKSFNDLEVYKLAHLLAMQIFKMTIDFPKEEKYSLTDQIRRSSRSIAANIAEGWGKRIFENNFKRHLIDAIGSVEETRSWLLFSKDSGYINEDIHGKLYENYEILGAKLHVLHEKWVNYKLNKMN
ncbi:four helix bundle protein [Chitinophaga japonensis]|uniref:Four helix bundle protein n=1 Tax=Chitinophaga japonensis TaxID=104662 RepID=A0A562SMF2_CHIJA|nr:four helix bundle protein [Chitinophaga japonensis]TWI82442.1 four helix bundle protein [Chitinophaga japonensis]